MSEVWRDLVEALTKSVALRLPTTVRLVVKSSLVSASVCDCGLMRVDDSFNYGSHNVLFVEDPSDFENDVAPGFIADAVKPIEYLRGSPEAVRFVVLDEPANSEADKGDFFLRLAIRGGRFIPRLQRHSSGRALRDVSVLGALVVEDRSTMIPVVVASEASSRAGDRARQLVRHGRGRDFGF